MLVEVTGDPAAAFWAARREVHRRQQEGTGAGEVAHPRAGGPARAPAASLPHPPAPRPGLSAASHVSPSPRRAAGERLDLVREMAARQRELQRQLDES